jgi:Right handed beta helix region
VGLKSKHETRRQNRPVMEALEGRIVLSTLHASNVTQLQADIAAVNNTSGPNTIVLKPGVYLMTSELHIQNAGNLTIRPGSTKSTTSLVGSVVDRVLEIDGGSVTLSGLSINGGGAVAQGGGILAQNASLTLKSTKVTSNISTQSGAGIYAQGGTLTLENSTVANNRSSSSTLAFGGGIVALNTNVTITSSSVSENSLFSYDQQTMGSVEASGAGIFAEGGSLTVTGSTLSGNTIYAVTTGPNASSSGAAISTIQTPVTVSKSTFQYDALNSVSYGGVARIEGSVFATNGGSLRLVHSTLGKNTPGGIKSFYHPGATVTIVNLDLDGHKFSGILYP